jgi:PAS domain S-box-containing protein
MAEKIMAQCLAKITCPAIWVGLVWRMGLPDARKSSLRADFLKALSKSLAPSTEAVTIADENGNILFANDEVERVYRRPKETVVNRHPLTFCPQDFSRKFSRQIFDTIQKRGGWDGVVVNVDATGRRFPILLRTVQVEFAGMRYIVSWAKPFPEKAPFKLSGKQAQCFKLLGEGLAPKEVAGRLGITTSSVNTHLKRVKEAIAKAQSVADTRSRSDLVNSSSALIDLGHLAVRCHEAGWEPMMRINASV